MGESLLDRLDRVGVHQSVPARYCKEAASEIRRLQFEAHKYYKADGSFELLASAEEVVKKGSRLPESREKLNKEVIMNTLKMVQNLCCQPGCEKASIEDLRSRGFDNTIEVDLQLHLCPDLETVALRHEQFHQALVAANLDFNTTERPGQFLILPKLVAVCLMLYSDRPGEFLRYPFSSMKDLDFDPRGPIRNMRWQEGFSSFGITALGREIVAPDLIDGRALEVSIILPLEDEHQAYARLRFAAATWFEKTGRIRSGLEKSFAALDSDTPPGRQ